MMAYAALVLFVWAYSHVGVGFARNVLEAKTTVMLDDCRRLKDHIDGVDEAFKERLPFTQNIYVNASVRVILTRNHLNYNRQEQYFCKVGFRTIETGYRMLLSWDYFTVGQRRNAKDWFRVVDLQSGLPLSSKMWGVMGQGTEGRRPPPTNDYHSIGYGLALYYKGHPYDDAMAVVITVFRDLDVNKRCTGNFTKCWGRNPICIDSRLRCNGDNNCGDSNRSDEDPSCHDKPWVHRVPPEGKDGTPLGLIGALCGIIVTGALILAVGFIVYWCKHRRRDRRSWFDDSHQSSFSQPPRSIDSLAQNGKIPVCNNTYTQLPTTTKFQEPTQAFDRHALDFSHSSDVSLPITLDADSSESNRNARDPANHSSRESVTFDTSTAAPSARFTNGLHNGVGVDNGAVGGAIGGEPSTGGAEARDGQIYYDMDEICGVYQQVS